MYGPKQSAYCKGRGSRNAVLVFVVRWLLAMSSGQRICVYCSDVSGAFDQVSTKLLLDKCKLYGVVFTPI